MLICYSSGWTGILLSHAGITVFPVSDVLVNGPNALRKQSRMKRAMHKIVTMHPGRFLIIDTQSQNPDRIGPQYYISLYQFNTYQETT